MEPEARDGTEEDERELSYGEKYAEVDTDRTVFVGVMIAVTMFFLFQGFILAAFQTPVISGDTPWLQPLKFCGITQAVYAVPTLFILINRQCPKMAKGFLIVTVLVFIGGTISLIVG